MPAGDTVSHSRSFDHRRRPETLRTAIATAFRLPTSTTSLLPRVIPVLTQHYAMLQRNLLYTGITRGKRLVVLVGSRKAVAIAVRNVSGRRRWSKLREWLAAPVIPTAA